MDTSLVSADSHGKTVQAASNYTLLAVQFMEKLYSSSKLEKMKIPTAECFLKRNPMNEENFAIWEADLKPEFEISDVIVPMKFIKWKTLYELLLANFSSRHIRTSKILCQKVCFFWKIKKYWSFFSCWKKNQIFQHYQKMLNRL